MESVTGAYNSVNGEACCCGRRLIGDVLRGECGFDGHFTSDCGAIRNICDHHRLADTLAEADTLAVKAGCVLNCGSACQHLISAIHTRLPDKAGLTPALCG